MIGDRHRYWLFILAGMLLMALSALANAQIILIPALLSIAAAIPIDYSRVSRHKRALRRIDALERELEVGPYAVDIGRELFRAKQSSADRDIVRGGGHSPDRGPGHSVHLDELISCTRTYHELGHERFMNVVNVAGWPWPFTLDEVKATTQYLGQLKAIRDREPAWIPLELRSMVAKYASPHEADVRVLGCMCFLCDQARFNLTINDVGKDDQRGVAWG